MRHPLNWLLRLVASRADSDALLGDIDEAYTRLRATRPWLRAQAWYTGQVLAATSLATLERLGTMGNTVTTALRPDSLIHDLRYSVRVWQRHLGFFIVAVLSLALGIAASTAILTIGDRVLLRALPYPDPDRLVALDRNASFAQHDRRGISLTPELTQLAEFVSLGLYDLGGLNLGDDVRPLRLQAAAASPEFFETLAVPAFAGRTFEKDEAGDNHVAIISFDLWRGHFGADRSVLGREIRLNSRPFTVVGVMPEGFTFPKQADVWVLPGADHQMTGSAFIGQVIGRLAPGVTIPDATRALLRARSESLKKEGFDEGVTPPNRGPMMTGLHAQLAAAPKPTLLLLIALASLLLAGTAVNIAGLLLSRYSAREQEIHARLALGATRARIVRQLVTEALVLAAAGALFGCAGAIWAVRLVSASSPALAAFPALTSIDGRFLAVGVAVAIVSSLGFSLGPAWFASRHSGSGVLRQGTTPDRQRRRFASALVVVQTSVALVLLIGATAALATLEKLTRVDLGFSNDRAVIFEVTLPRERYKTSAAVADFFDRLEVRLRAIPGVTQAGATNLAPGDAGVTLAASLVLADSPTPSRSSSLTATVGSDPPFASILAATPDYFNALGIGLVAGRFFTLADANGPPVVILNESAARQLDGDVTRLVGRHFVKDEDLNAAEIVGIVRDVTLNGYEVAARSKRSSVYQPLRKNSPRGSIGVAIGTAGDVAAVIAAARSVLAELDADLPLYNVVPVHDLRARFLATERLTMALAGAFAVIALGLAAIGIYALLAQTVSQRTREIGIRMALGAGPGRLRLQIIRRASVLALAGIVIGGAAGLGGWHLIGTVIPNTTVPGVPALVLDATLLVIVALIAAWLPARRASAIDPVQALK